MRRLWLLAALASLFWANALYAQDYIGEAESAYVAGEYEKAAQAATEYFTKNPKDKDSRWAKQLGFYVTVYEYRAKGKPEERNFEAALAVLKPLSELPDWPEMRELGCFHLADCYMAYGDSLQKNATEEGQKKRKEAYEAAEKAFKQYDVDRKAGKFANKEGVFANAIEIGLAKTYAAQGKYEVSLKQIDSLIKTLTSKKDLQPYEFLTLLQAFPVKLSAAGGYANDLIAQKKGADAEKFLGAIKQEFDDFIKKQTSANTSNEVAWEVGGMLASAKNYTDAIRFFRLMKSKEDILAALKDQKEAYNQQYTREWKAANIQDQVTKDDKKTLSKAVEKKWGDFFLNLEAKRKQIETGDDPLIAAFSQIAQCYVGMNRLQEAFLIFNRLPSSDKPEFRKDYLKRLILSAAAARQHDKAAQQLADYEKEFPGADPTLELALYFIGNAYEAERNHARAMEYYERILKEYPKGEQRTETLLRLGIVLFQEKQYEAADAKFEEYFNALNNVKPPDKDYYYLRGKTLAQLKQWKQAVEPLSELNKRFPDYPWRDDAVLVLINALANCGSLTEALEISKNYLAEDRTKESPVRPGLRFQQASLHVACGQLTEAEKIFGELAGVANHPLVPLALMELAKLHVKDKAKLEADLRRIFEAKDVPEETLAEAHFLLGWAHHQDKQFDKAVAEYQLVVDKFPTQPRAVDAQYNIAVLCFAPIEKITNPATLSGLDRANWDVTFQRTLGAYEKLIERFPNSLYAEVALTFLVDKHFLKVQEKIATETDVETYFRGLAKRFGDKDPRRARVLFALGNFYHKLPSGKPQALKIFSEAYALSPDAVRYVLEYTQFADLLVKDKQYDQSVKLAEQLLVAKFSDPNHQAYAEVEGHWWLGHISFLKEEWEKALEHLTLLKDKSWAPHYADARYEMACISEAKAKSAAELEAILKQFTEIARSPGPLAIRAKSALRTGYVRKKMAEAAKPADAAKLLLDARKAFVMVDTNFEAEKETAAEALYQGGQLLELEKNNPEAISCYQRAVGRSNGEYGQKAAERLNALGAPLPSPK